MLFNSERWQHAGYTVQSHPQLNELWMELPSIQKSPRQWGVTSAGTRHSARREGWAFNHTNLSTAQGHVWSVKPIVLVLHLVTGWRFFQASIYSRWMSCDVGSSIFNQFIHDELIHDRNISNLVFCVDSWVAILSINYNQSKFSLHMVWMSTW